MRKLRQAQAIGLFKREVRNGAEQILQVLAPEDLINWGGLKYPNLLKYLVEKINEEIVAEEKEEDLDDAS